MFNKFERNSRGLILVAVVLFVVAFVLILMLLNGAAGSKNSYGNAIGLPGQSQSGPTPTVIALVFKKAFSPLSQLSMRDMDPKTFAEDFTITHASQPVTDYVPGPVGLEQILLSGPHILGQGAAVGNVLLTPMLVTNTAPGAVDYSSILDSGQVAQTLNAQPLNSEMGLVQPGDYVNVLLSLKKDVLKSTYDNHQNMQYVPSVSSLAGLQSGAVIGYYLESQTTLENLKVLTVSGNNYTLEMNNQDALVIKNLRDTATDDASRFVIDLVVRSSLDTKPKLAGNKNNPGYKFNTRPVNTSFLINPPYSPSNRFGFNLP